MDIKFLDCTLRDGAYINDGKFGEETIKNIVEFLSLAKVDIIECGWLKNDSYDTNTSYFKNITEFKNKVYDKIKIENGTKLCLMLDYNRYDVQNIEKYIDVKKYIDFVRLTFPYDHVDEGLLQFERLKDKGYDISLQLTNTKMYVSDFTKAIEAKEKLVKSVNELKPICVCFADTFGSLYPEEIKKLAEYFDNKIDKTILLGMHTHNNMNLAFANILSFIEYFKSKNIDRGIVVDGSITGMGRGAGNAPSEVLSNYLNKTEGKSYDVNLILKLIDNYLLKDFEKKNYGYNPYLAVTGMCGSHISRYLKNTNMNLEDFKKMLEGLTIEERCKSI